MQFEINNQKYKIEGAIISQGKKRFAVSFENGEKISKTTVNFDSIKLLRESGDLVTCDDNLIRLIEEL